MVDVDAPVILMSGAERVNVAEGEMAMTFSSNVPLVAMKMGCVIFVFVVVSRENENELNLTREVGSVVLISKMLSPEIFDAFFLTAFVCPFTSIAVVNDVVDVSAM